MSMADSGAVQGSVRAASESFRTKGLTVWFTGLSGAGKTALCQHVHAALAARGLAVETIDGDMIREHLCKDLGFTEEDRRENIRRISYISHLLTRNGIVVLVAAISPYRSSREQARSLIGRFLEVYVNAPLEVCESRDPKGLYRRARSGALKGFTGIDQPYEPPLSPEVECCTDLESVEQSATRVMARILESLGLPE